jgi:hypothetical protein
VKAPSTEENQMTRKLLLAAGLCLGLGGCATIAGWLGGTPQSQTITVHSVLAACDGFYKGALKAAFVADDAGLVTPAVKADIHSIRLGVDSICPPAGTMPTNLAQALVTIVEGGAKVYLDIGAKP